MDVDLSSMMVQSEEPTPEPEPEYDYYPEPKGPEPAQTETPVDRLDDNERNDLITRLQLCIDNFPHKLSAYKSTKLDKMSDEELKKLEGKIEYTMDAQT